MRSTRDLFYARHLDKSLQELRARRGAYPASRQELVQSLRTQPPGDFDYWIKDGTYLLIYPSFRTGAEVEPFVFQDGELIRYPPGMSDVVEFAKSPP